MSKMEMPCSECIQLNVSGPIVSICGGYFCDDCFIAHHCGKCDTEKGKRFNNDALRIALEVDNDRHDD